MKSAVVESAIVEHGVAEGAASEGAIIMDVFFYGTGTARCEQHVFKPMMLMQRAKGSVVMLPALHMVKCEK